MAITAPIAGAYTSVWNSVPVLYTRQGWNLNFMLKGERIEETDLFGLSLIEIIYRGAQLTMDAVGKIYGNGTTGPVRGWVTSFGQVYTATRPIAQAASALVASSALVLTAVANTPAQSTPATLTGAVAIISPDNNFQYIFDSRVREAPLKFDILTIDTAGTGSLFSTT